MDRFTVSDNGEIISKKRMKTRRNTEMKELTHVMARMVRIMEQN